MNAQQKQIVIYAGTIASLLGIYYCQEHEKKMRKRRRLWVREIFQQRAECGFYNNLIQEMKMFDHELFFNFTRMNVNTFEFLLSLVAPHITKNSPRKPIPPACRLLVTLRYLVTGDSYRSLSYSFRMAPATICCIVRETCTVLWNILMPICMKPPTLEEWQTIKDEFYSLWQMPNCLGAIDGKHIAIQAPAHSGSLYYNYKHYFSVVLLGICNANYSFTFVDIGAYGAQSDGGIFKKSRFGQQLYNGTLTSLTSAVLPNTSTSVAVPTYFIGDEAFPLRTNLMRPFSKRIGPLPEDEAIFNYRLSRARRTIENTFGILVARFRIFHRVINASPETVDLIIKASTCLHNFIKSQTCTANQYCSLDFVDHEVDGVVVAGCWRSQIPTTGALQPVQFTRFGNRNAPREAWEYRVFLKDYVNGIGSLACPWQLDHVRKTH